MTKISDERLGELISHTSRTISLRYGDSLFNDLESALRELLDYRKAVREYLEADSSLYVVDGKIVSKRAEAEANLRALQEKP